MEEVLSWFTTSLTHRIYFLCQYVRWTSRNNLQGWIFTTTPCTSLTLRTTLCGLYIHHRYVLENEKSKRLHYNRNSHLPRPFHNTYRRGDDFGLFYCPGQLRQSAKYSHP